ncbi:hypothetical protein GZH46_01661, partial [Fragariocoptes setiger]
LFSSINRMDTDTSIPETTTPIDNQNQPATSSSDITTDYELSVQSTSGARPTIDSNVQSCQHFMKQQFDFNDSTKLKEFIQHLSGQPSGLTNDYKCIENYDLTSKADLLREILIEMFAQRPTSIDDDVYSLCYDFYRKFDIRASGYLDCNSLVKLSKSKQSTLTWIKYEKLLCKMIAMKILTLNVVEQEVMNTVRQNLDTVTLQKISGLLASCAKQSRQMLRAADEDAQKLSFGIPSDYHNTGRTMMIASSSRGMNSSVWDPKNRNIGSKTEEFQITESRYGDADDAEQISELALKPFEASSPFARDISKLLQIKQGHYSDVYKQIDTVVNPDEAATNSSALKGIQDTVASIVSQG